MRIDFPSCLIDLIRRYPGTLLACLCIFKWAMVPDQSGLGHIYTCPDPATTLGCCGDSWMSTGDNPALTRVCHLEPPKGYNHTDRPDTVAIAPHRCKIWLCVHNGTALAPNRGTRTLERDTTQTRSALGDDVVPFAVGVVVTAILLVASSSWDLGSCYPLLLVCSALY